MTKQNKPSKWEKELKNEIRNYLSEPDDNSSKDFVEELFNETILPHINNLLSDQRKEMIEMIKKMQGVKRGRWIINPMWVERENVIKIIKSK